MIQIDPINIPPSDLVVYSAVFGGYSDILPQKQRNGVTYICFTDDPTSLINAKGWRIIRVKPPVEDDPIRSNRYFKMHPHILFPKNELSVYIDSNYLVLQNPIKFVNDVLSFKNMAVFSHNACSDKRNCIYEEHEALVLLNKKGNKKGILGVMQKQIDSFRSEGFPSNYGLIFAAVLIRRHNQEDVIQAMEFWWKTIVSGSRRDQLSFDYMRWKLKFKVKYIEEDLRRRNGYFYWIGEHRKSFTWKFVKYNLKSFLGFKPRVK